MLLMLVTLASKNCNVHICSRKFSRKYCSKFGQIPSLRVNYSNETIMKWTTKVSGIKTEQAWYKIHGKQD